MKKLMLTVSVLVVALMSLLVSPTYAYAETQETLFNNLYNYLVTTSVDDVGIAEYSVKVEDAVVLAESIMDDDAIVSNIKGFEDKYKFILKKYKLYVINYKLDALYNLSDYSDSANGKPLLLNEKSIAKYSIECAVNKKQVDDAYNAFYSLIEKDEFAKNTNAIKTSIESLLTAEATIVDGTLSFSTDDCIVISKVNNSAVVKNMNSALLVDGVTSMQNPGVAYYFNIQLNKNGTIVNEFDKKLKLKIKVEDLGLELPLENGSLAQVAKYNGNETIALTDASVVNGYVEFEIDALGEYAICLEGYKVESKNYADIFDKYKGYLLLALLAIFLTVAPIRYNRKLKRKQLKKEKQEYKAYKHYKKQMKKKK